MNNSFSELTGNQSAQSSFEKTSEVDELDETRQEQGEKLAEDCDESAKCLEEIKRVTDNLESSRCGEIINETSKNVSDILHEGATTVEYRSDISGHNSGVMAAEAATCFSEENKELRNSSKLEEVKQRTSYKALSVLNLAAGISKADGAAKFWGTHGGELKKSSTELDGVVRQTKSRVAAVLSGF